jgi:hypothetical protein
MTSENITKEENEIIKINVGGRIFMTTKETFLKIKTETKEKDTKGIIFFDRDSESFRYILLFLRDKNNFELFSKLPPFELDLLEKEAKFYGIKDLYKLLSNEEQIYSNKLNAYRLEYSKWNFYTPVKYYGQMMFSSKSNQVLNYDHFNEKTWKIIDNNVFIILNGSNQETTKFFQNFKDKDGYWHLAGIFTHNVVWLHYLVEENKKNVITKEILEETNFKCYSLQNGKEKSISFKDGKVKSKSYSDFNSYKIENGLISIYNKNGEFLINFPLAFKDYNDRWIISGQINQTNKGGNILYLIEEKEYDDFELKEEDLVDKKFKFYNINGYLGTYLNNI